ncbi:MAG: DoxX family protein [Gracilimonas sp.]|nr:DoxX family protein [Gracilimonas sp.]
MNIAIWILQVLMALMFMMAGSMKILQPKDQLKEKVGDWVDDFSAISIKSIGVLEVFGALGLVLPMILNILPVLTIWAASGLAMTMIGAIVLHISRKEYKMLITNFVLLILVSTIAIGRLIIAPV